MVEVSEMGVGTNRQHLNDLASHNKYCLSFVNSPLFWNNSRHKAYAGHNEQYLRLYIDYNIAIGLLVVSYQRVYIFIPASFYITVAN